VAVLSTLRLSPCDSSSPSSTGTVLWTPSDLRVSSPQAEGRPLETPPTLYITERTPTERDSDRHTTYSPLEIQTKTTALSMVDRCGPRAMAITARELHPAPERQHCPNVVAKNLRPRTPRSDRPTHSSIATLGFPDQSSDSEERSPSLEPLGIGLTLDGLLHQPVIPPPYLGDIGKNRHCWPCPRRNAGEQIIPTAIGVFGHEMFGEADLGPRWEIKRRCMSDQEGNISPIK
jgi:hypothetical protein